MISHSDSETTAPDLEAQRRPDPQAQAARPDPIKMGLGDSRCAAELASGGGDRQMFAGETGSWKTVLKSQIRQHPAAAVCTALCVGGLAGWLTSSRR